MDFSKVKSLVIPEGDVCGITSGVDVLWRKKYKRQLGYLKSTGTQYINTKRIPSKYHSNKCELMGEFSSASSATAFGARAGEANTFIFISTSTNRFRIDYGRSVALRFVSWTPSKNTQANRVVIDGKNRNATIYFSDGTTESHGYNQSNTLTITNQSILLFAYNDVGTPRICNGMKISAYRWHDGSTLLQDFIPVLDWNDVPCMYDKVTDELFYNAGTGEFEYGD